MTERQFREIGLFPGENIVLMVAKGLTMGFEYLGIVHGLICLRHPFGNQFLDMKAPFENVLRVERIDQIERRCF